MKTPAPAALALSLAATSSAAQQDECGVGGVLAIEWENTRVHAPFTVAP